MADLVGSDRIDDAGEVVGVVSDSFETAAHEVLVVRREATGCLRSLHLRTRPGRGSGIGACCDSAPEG